MRVMKNVGRVRRASAATVAAISAALMLVVTGADGASAAATGVWQDWAYPATEQGFSHTDEVIKVHQSAPTRFFSHDIDFVGGSGAYIGIQETDKGRIAIFSVWDSPGGAVAGHAGASCDTFGGEGVGWSCQSPYAWQVGKEYRLRFMAIKKTAAGETRWMGSVKELPDGPEVVLGYLWSGAGQWGIKSSESWIEDYGNALDDERCITRAPAAATFYAPTLDGGSVRVGLGLSRTWTCPGSTHQSSIYRLTSSERPGALLVQ